MVEIFIENIIASATISSELNLDNIINTLPNCEYNPGQFSGVIYRPEAPPVVVLLFNSGKIMITAAKSIQDVENSIKMVEKQLKDAGLLTPPEPAEEKVEGEGKETPVEEPEQTPEGEREEKPEEKPEQTPEGEREEMPEEKPEQTPEGKSKETPGKKSKKKSDEKKEK